MSNFSQFMKANKKVKENTTYAATKSIVDKDGKPVLWELRPISSKENTELRESCMKEIPIKGKNGMYRQKISTSEYIAKLLVASCVSPDLYDSALQDSYGVMTPEELLYALVDDPGEYDDFAAFVQKFNGFTTSLEDKVDEAKN
ncbi:phage tail assembly chaperone [Acutalibacter sp. 1XD8-36]|uniref:phage tail assembly chaperone n=1 Tax=Acutalibacter sp. 1XD8-36 TaxID=2320852 RepID=UPI0014136C30|nr:hypothetical protein [Acutalibacter sp. 1XD8-36]NBJ89922.1 hypothetical protein [Acutalibacter sp. 1XD8-36]